MDWYLQLELSPGEMIREVALHVDHANVWLVYWFLHLMRSVWYLTGTVIISMKANIQTDLLINMEGNQSYNIYTSNVWLVQYLQ